MCDHPGCNGPDTEDPLAVSAWRDQQDAWLRETIRKHGWAIQAVLGDDQARIPPMSYTVGLWGFGHPELVIFGLQQRHAGRVLNELGELVRAGATLRAGECVDGGSPLGRMTLLELPNAYQVTLVAQEVYRTDGGAAIPAVQVCWADLRGAYPWEPGYRYPSWLQPMPGTFAA